MEYMELIFTSCLSNILVVPLKGFLIILDRSSAGGRPRVQFAKPDGASQMLPATLDLPSLADVIQFYDDYHLRLRLGSSHRDDGSPFLSRSMDHHLGQIHCKD